MKTSTKRMVRRIIGLLVVLLVGFLVWLLLFSTDQVKTVPRNIPDDSPRQTY